MIVSRVCEEFPAYTVETAIRALTEDPERRVMAIMELRAYIRTRDAINAAEKAEDEPQTSMAKWVCQVQGERMRQRKAERKRRRGRG